MKKKILTLLFSLILCLCIVTPAFAAQTDGFASEYERVQDLAGLLSGNEESSLVTKLNELSERQKMDIVVLTTDTLDGKTPRDYADDIYDYGNFGYGESRDGALLLISIEDNDWYVSTCGYGITVFTDAGIEYIGKQIKGELSDGNFAGAFDKFADLCDDFITQARTGEPYDVKNLPKEPLSLIWIPITIVNERFADDFQIVMPCNVVLANGSLACNGVAFNFVPVFTGQAAVNCRPVNFSGHKNNLRFLFGVIHQIRKTKASASCMKKTR